MVLSCGSLCFLGLGIHMNFACGWSSVVCSDFIVGLCFFFFSSRRRHTRFDCDWSSDVCSSDLVCRNSLDDVVGIISVARLLALGSDAAGTTLYEHVLPASFLPETLSAMELLEQLRARSGRMVFVVDEYGVVQDRKSTRLNSSHSQISYAVFCLKKKKNNHLSRTILTREPPRPQILTWPSVVVTPDTPLSSYYDFPAVLPYDTNQEGRHRHCYAW